MGRRLAHWEEKSWAGTGKNHWLVQVKSWAGTGTGKSWAGTGKILGWHR
jgi:hypothetical protein